MQSRGRRALWAELRHNVKVLAGAAFAQVKSVGSSGISELLEKRKKILGLRLAWVAANGVARVAGNMGY